MRKETFMLALRMWLFLCGLFVAPGIIKAIVAASGVGNFSVQEALVETLQAVTLWTAMLIVFCLAIGLLLIYDKLRGR